MTPARRYDAVGYALRSGTRLDPQVVARTNARLRRRTPAIVDAGGAAYVADALAASWPAGFFRDALSEKTSGLAEVPSFVAMRRLNGDAGAVGSDVFWCIVYNVRARRSGRAVLDATTTETLGVVVKLAGVNDADMLDDMQLWGSDLAGSALQQRLRAPLFLAREPSP